MRKRTDCGGFVSVSVSVSVLYVYFSPFSMFERMKNRNTRCADVLLIRRVNIESDRITLCDNALAQHVRV